MRKFRPGSTKEGSCLARIRFFTCNAGYNLRLVFNTAGKTRQNFIPFNQDHVITTLREKFLHLFQKSLPFVSANLA